jgi:hypothetical protein
MPASTRSLRAGVPPIDPLAYAPTPLRPVRAKLRGLAAATRVDPHNHAWAPVAMSSTGAIRMTAGSSTYLVPPSRALWIPPGMDLPDDKRLRQLCEAVPDEPTRFFT